MVVAADPVADEALDDREPGALDHGLHPVRDVPNAVVDARLADPGRERLLRDLEQALRLGRSPRRPTVYALSAMYASSVTPTSIVTRSPSATSYGPGMPWTTTSFCEMQIALGKGPVGPP